MKTKIKVFLLTLIMSIAVTANAYAGEFHTDPAGNTYYIQDDGSYLRNSFLFEDSELYMFRHSGIMHTTGWLNAGDYTDLTSYDMYWYYFDSTGKAKYNCIFLDAKTGDLYLFEDYYMTQTPGRHDFNGNTYYVRENSFGDLLHNEWLRGEYGLPISYFDTNGIMLKDQSAVIDGKICYFDSEGIYYDGDPIS